MSDDILFEVEDGVAFITLNRPERLNAFTSSMLRDLLGALQEAGADDEVRAVLITGSGRAFCAGQDLSDPAIAGDDADLGALLEERYHPVLLTIRKMRKPVVMAVNGVAAGAGANFALTGDVVLAAKSAQFIQAFSKVGLLPDSGGTFALPYNLGRARALGLGLFGDPLSAEQAKEWGLIWDVVDDDDLATEARRVAGQLASGPTAAYAATKRAIDAAASNSLDEQLNVERDLQRELGRSEDFKEGIAAFKEKREPKFGGK